MLLNIESYSHLWWLIFLINHFILWKFSHEYCIYINSSLLCPSNSIHLYLVIFKLYITFFKNSNILNNQTVHPWKKNWFALSQLLFISYNSSLIKSKSFLNFPHWYWSVNCCCIMLDLFRQTHCWDFTGASLCHA